MPSSKDFDDIIKGKFNGFEAPLPDGGWDKIKNRIPQKRRRPVLLPLMAAASVFFAILSGYLFLKQQDLEASLRASEQAKQNLMQPAAPSADEAMTASSVQGDAVRISDEPSSLSSPQSAQASSQSAVPTSNAVASTRSSEPVSTTEHSAAPGAIAATTITVPVSNTSLLPGATDALIAAVGTEVNAANTDPITTVVAHNEMAHAATGVGSNTTLNAVNAGISKAMFRHIVLAESAGRIPELIPAIVIEEVTQDGTNEDADEEEDAPTASKWHVGVGASTFITSKVQKANTDDPSIVSSYQQVNEFNKERVGAGANALVGYDVSSNVQLIGSVDYTRFQDKSSYTLLEELATPVAVVNDDNSISLSSYTEREVTTVTSLQYLGVKGGVRCFFIPGSSYIQAKGGSHLLLNAREQGNGGGTPAYYSMTYSAALSLGRRYAINDKYSLYVEPELGYYLRPYAQGGDTQSTPYTLGFNLVLMR